MRLKYNFGMRHWVGARPYPTWDGFYGCRFVTGSFRRAAWFALTGRGFGTKPPFWTFRVDCRITDGSDQYGECSAGFFSKWLYIEVLQGRSLCDGMFYRWLRIGIPTHGCWRIRLQKRWM